MADGLVQTPVADIEYVRPSDRSPDKDFHKRSDEEKKRVCITRSAVSKAREKINRLEDEVEEREAELKSERELRRVAEDRLTSYLQDMYRNPDVNEELRQRLPRANKYDSFKVEETEAPLEAEESSIEEQIVVEVDEKNMSKPRMKPEDRKTLESQIIAADGSRSNSSKSPKSSRRNLDFAETSEPSTSQAKTSMETQTGGVQRSPTHPFIGLTPPQGYFGQNFGASPFLPSPFNGSALNYSYPFMQSGSMFPQSSTLRHSSTPVLNTSFLGDSISRSASSTLNTQPNTSTADGLSGRPEGLGTTGRDVGTMDSGVSLGSTGGPFSSLRMPGMPQQNTSMSTSLLPDPFLSMSQRHMAGPGMEQGRQLATLLAELDAQKQESKKLANRIAEQEREIGTMKVSMKAREAEKQAETSDTEKAAGLVEEVYAAQKKRDEATMGRMRVANQEKEDVLVRLREIERKIEADNRHYPDVPSDDDLDEAELETGNIDLLLSRLESPTATENDCTVFVSRVEALRLRQRELTNEEMQVIIEQRDAALAKCHKLEAELLRYQRQTDGGSNDKNLKAKLAAVQQERNMAVAKHKQLDDEIQTLRLYYSLHKSLSQEESIKQQTDHALGAYQSQLMVSSGEVAEAQKENDHLTTQLRAVTIEKTQLAEALEMAKTDNGKLQRLVAVLRKKLNALSSQPEDARD